MKNAQFKCLKGWTLLHLVSFLDETYFGRLVLMGGANANAKMGMAGPRCTWHHFSGMDLLCFSCSCMGGANANVQDKESLHSRWNQRWETTMSREGIEETWYIENYRVRQILRVVSDNSHGVVEM